MGQRPQRRLSAAVLATVLAAGCVTPPPPESPPAVITLEQAIAAPYRDANRPRDVYRHPQQTLDFFGLTDDMTVMEVWPANGWYTEILAPYLRAHGHYIAAQFPDDPSAPEFQKRTLEGFRKAVANTPTLFDRVTITHIGAPKYWQPVQPGTVDLVLSFSNVHNWLAMHTEREMFAAFYRSLKPGGVLGIVEHRAYDETPAEDMIRTGYVTQDLVIQLATEAGFTWVAWEEINANPKDTKDYPGGVWTLPPTLALGEVNRDKYLAIGESDRMTLKFVKTP